MSWFRLASTVKRIRNKEDKMELTVMVVYSFVAPHMFNYVEQRGLKLSWMHIPTSRWIIEEDSCRVRACEKSTQQRLDDRRGKGGDVPNSGEKTFTGERGHYWMACGAQMIEHGRTAKQILADRDLVLVQRGSGWRPSEFGVKTMRGTQRTSSTNAPGEERLNKSFTKQPMSDTQQSQIPGIHISATQHRTEGGTLRRDIEGSRCWKENEERGKKRGTYPVYSVGVKLRKWEWCRYSVEGGRTNFVDHGLIQRTGRTGDGRRSLEELAVEGEAGQKRAARSTINSEFKRTTRGFKERGETHRRFAVIFVSTARAHIKWSNRTKGTRHSGVAIVEKNEVLMRNRQ
ncbi:hypothetical protein B0H14DRAFT_3762256 [Mycena olivaceomarginata]|nr:hypothetical protein B0H14DRAFT_3762256 [Mycena olivaceomarginata]